MFNCRQLDGGINVLRMDYRVSCNTPQHTTFRAAAGVVIVAFSLGIPVYMVMRMLRRMRDYSASSDSDRFVARRVADELKIDDREAGAAIRDVSTGQEYSFLVNSFKVREPSAARTPLAPVV